SRSSSTPPAASSGSARSSAGPTASRRRRRPPLLRRSNRDVRSSVKRITTPRPASPRQNCQSRRCFFLAPALLAMLAGCASAPRQIAVRIAQLDAVCLPPAGWMLDRAELADHYAQRVWVSPTGKTSYGVIHFTMPLPLGNSIALAAFLSELKR